MSDVYLRQYIGDLHLRAHWPEVATHISCNEDGSIFASVSVFLGVQDTSDECRPGSVSMHCCIFLYSLTRDKHLHSAFVTATLSAEDTIVHRELGIVFHPSQATLAVSVYLTLASGERDNNYGLGRTFLCDFSNICGPKRASTSSSTGLNKLFGKFQPKDEERSEGMANMVQLGTVLLFVSLKGP